MRRNSNKEDGGESTRTFSEKLAAYLMSQHKEQFEVAPPIEDDLSLWYVRSQSLAIHEDYDEEGKVHIESYDLENLHYFFEEDDVYDHHDVAAFLEKLKDRKNWDYLARRVCPHVVAYLTWADMIAKQVSEEENVRVVHWFPGADVSPLVKFSHFHSEIYSQGMNDDEKISAIAKAIPAVLKAYNLARDEEEQEAFIKEFVKSIKSGKQPRNRA